MSSFVPFRRPTLFFLLIVTMVSSACTQPDGELPAPPDTTAAALWEHLASEDYAKTWQLWPGTTAFYQGNDPHGALLTTYVNPPAMTAISNKAGEMPAGAIIVKENYTPDRTLAATTVMYKAAGYDAEHKDWFWMKRLSDGVVEAEGKVEGCIKCHGMASDNDYTFTSILK